MLPKEKDGVVNSSLKVERLAAADLDYVTMIVAGIRHRESPSGRCVHRALAFRGTPPM